MGWTGMQTSTVILRGRLVGWGLARSTRKQLSVVRSRWDWDIFIIRSTVQPFANKCYIYFTLAPFVVAVQKMTADIPQVHSRTLSHTSKYSWNPKSCNPQWLQYIAVYGYWLFTAEIVLLPNKCKEFQGKQSKRHLEGQNDCPNTNPTSKYASSHHALHYIHVS